MGSWIVQGHRERGASARGFQKEWNNGLDCGQLAGFQPILLVLSHSLSSIVHSGSYRCLFLLSLSVSFSLTLSLALSLSLCRFSLAMATPFRFTINDVTIEKKSEWKGERESFSGVKTVRVPTPASAFHLKSSLINSGCLDPFSHLKHIIPPIYHGEF